MVWEAILYPSREFQPDADPSEYEFTPEFAMVAVSSHLHQPGAQPVLPIEYRYTLPYLFFEPYPETFFDSAWLPGTGQSEPTSLMPVYDKRFTHGDIPNIPSVFFEFEPGTLFEVVWFPGTGQLEPASLMPTYDERFIHGDIANYPYSTLQLAVGVQFEPDGVGNFLDPSTFSVLEGLPDFEIRTPL